MLKFLAPFQGHVEKPPPIWFMRQAGRYLPEYQTLRKKHPNFMERCFSPQISSEITLQPLRRFDFDAAIIFSDILVIPYALAQDVVFKEGEGPLLSPLSLSTYEKSLSFAAFSEKLSPVYEALQLTRRELAADKALLGFAGAPWTLALYMLEGKGSRDFSKAKTEAFQNESLFSQFLEMLTHAISLHLVRQIKAGASAVQLFDTWASHCPDSHFESWIVNPTRQIVSTVRQSYPDIPFIGFPKGIGANLVTYGEKTGVSALSLDAATSLSWANKVFPSPFILQGNIDPLLLAAGGQPLKIAIQRACEEMKGRAYIFNLGHGILPHTPLKHVEECIAWVRERA